MTERTSPTCISPGLLAGALQGFTDLAAYMNKLKLHRCAGDERHCVFDCPHFQSLRQQHAMIFRDSHDAMRSVMWHKDQKSVCALVLAIVNEAQTL